MTMLLPPLIFFCVLLLGKEGRREKRNRFDTRPCRWEKSSLSSLLYDDNVSFVVAPSDFPLAQSKSKGRRRRLVTFFPDSGNRAFVLEARPPLTLSPRQISPYGTALAGGEENKSSGVEKRKRFLAAAAAVGKEGGRRGSKNGAHAFQRRFNPFFTSGKASVTSCPLSISLAQIFRMSKTT